MMRSSVLCCLAVSFAMFGFGLSLQCYSCPLGTTSTNSCEVKTECNQNEDRCLKLTHNDKTYTRCVRYTDCNFMTLSLRYSITGFSFDCCQSDLCNAKENAAVWRISWVKK